MDEVMLRAIERLLAVIIGGLCVYLGYRLFLCIPEQKEGEGKIEFPGGTSIFVTRVGPGVFFHVRSRHRGGVDAEWHRLFAT